MTGTAKTEVDNQENGGTGTASSPSSECCRQAWLAALTLAENVLLDEVYDRIQFRSSQEAVRECVLAMRALRRLADTDGRSYCDRDI